MIKNQAKHFRVHGLLRLMVLIFLAVPTGPLSLMAAPPVALEQGLPKPPAGGFNGETRLSLEKDSPATGINTTLFDAQPDHPPSHALAESVADQLSGKVLKGEEGEIPHSSLEILNEDEGLETGDPEAAAIAEHELSGHPASGENQPLADAEAGETAGQPSPLDRWASAPLVEAALEAQQPLDSDPFPTSPAIEQQKAFWIRIFAKATTSQGLLHDGRIALPVYKAIELTGLSYRQQKRKIRQEKLLIRNNLRSLASALENTLPLTPEQETLLALFPGDINAKVLRDFSRNIRFQRGLSDRFQKGQQRASALMPHILEILRRYGLPEDLAYLPHVESSFNNRSYSKAGAAGIWQFTRSTGRRYLKVGTHVDERLDPLLATEAAAKFLLANFKMLGSWPLAITAYNHGPHGLKRITRQLGTTDLSVMIQGYTGRLFKFASKNFYAEFLAVREVANNYEQYFEQNEPLAPLRFSTVRLLGYLEFSVTAKAAGLTKAGLAALNPSLRRIVVDGTKYVPKGYDLKIPESLNPDSFLQAVPALAWQAKQKRTTTVVVRRGDTLYDIGHRLGIAWGRIARANNLSGRDRIYPGRRLIIPASDKQLPPLRTDDPVASTSKPATAKKPAPVLARGDLPLQSEQIHSLVLRNVDEKKSQGEITTAWGETIGLYAQWANISLAELRMLNGLGRSRRLQPSRTLLIPLDGGSEDSFNQARFHFHAVREKDFHSTFKVVKTRTVKVRYGQSVWSLAQANSIPMWLFYSTNPNLLNQPLHPGMRVILPVLEKLTLAAQMRKVLAVRSYPVGGAGIASGFVPSVRRSCIRWASALRGLSRNGW